MPAKRRGMADFIAQQRELIEDPVAGDQRPGLAPVPDTPAHALAIVPETGPAAPAPEAFPASAVPVPHSPTGHGQLSDAEEADLATCEAALDNLRVAFWAAGKALQAVRDARLYRGTHDTFEAYCEERWEISRAQAYRLMSAWPLAERLSPIGDKITESQVRELMPVSDTHGQDAAAVVYETVAGTDGVTITAARLHDVVAILPAGPFNADAAIAQIRAYLAGELTPPGPPPADRGQAFTAQTARLVKALQRETDPGVVRKAVADLRAALDEIEREIT